MARTIALLSGAVLCAALLTACGNGTTSSPSSAGPAAQTGGNGAYGGYGAGAAPSSPAPSSVPASGGTIRIQGFAFSPSALTVRVGSTVTVTNLDTTDHTWTATDTSFDSGALAKGASFSFTFTTPGTFAYRCSIHPSMHGTVTVTP